MAQVLASSKLDKFDLKGELDELAPLIKNGLYKKFNFEGALHTYVNLKECNILLLMRRSSSGIKSNLELLCNNITFKDIQNDTDFFTSMTVDYAKNYDLIIFDSNAWSIPNEDLRKSIELTDSGIPCLMIGNDTNSSYYGTGCQGLTVTDSSDIKTSYIISDNIGFSMNSYIYNNLSDGLCFPTSFSDDRMFPLLRCKNYYPIIAYESTCNTLSVMDYTAALTLNKDFMVNLLKWLISSKDCVHYKDEFMFGDGLVCQLPYKNLWERYPGNGKFSTSAICGNWSYVIDFPYELIDEFDENVRIIKCAPKNGMNYFAIDARRQLQEFPDSSYPTGTKYRISCWVYVENCCDMTAGYVKILGEAMTEIRPSGYDFNKKGTWQYITATVTSNNNGFYFLLYANRGGEDLTWTKGNVYFANVTVCKADFEDRRYIDFEKSNNDSMIPINIKTGTNFTVVYEYKQLLNYSKNFTEYTNREILFIKDSSGKNLPIRDYYVPNGKSMAWLGFDDYVTGQQEPGWYHLHIDQQSGREKDDEAFIILRKNGSEFSWFISKNGTLYRSSTVNASKYQNLVNFAINTIEIRTEHGGLAKSLSVYKRALSIEEITKLTKSNHMSISLEGDLITNKLTEQGWIPDNCFYTSLAEDSCKNFIKTQDIIHVEDWVYSGNAKNYLGKNCLSPNGSDLVTCKYNEVENEYTIHVPKNDSMLWYNKGIRLNSVKVEGNERYVMSFEFYCDSDLNISIDLNNSTSGIASNDNHESTVYANTYNKQKGGIYHNIYIIYDLMNNSPTFDCVNAIYIDQSETIPPQGVTFKIRDIRLHKIIGGKTGNIKNRYYPWSDRDTYSKNLKFNLHEDIGLDWSSPWTIVYMKKPLATNRDNTSERGGYLIDSIGCNNNSVGGGYAWFGKYSGMSNGVSISGGSSVSYNPDDFYYKQQMCVLKYENGKLIFTVYLENGTKMESSINYTLTTPNKFVTQFGYDLLLGGWDNTTICQAYYKDLIVAQRCLTEQELLKIFKTRIIDKPNNMNILGILDEGGI